MAIDSAIVRNFLRDLFGSRLVPTTEGESAIAIKLDFLDPIAGTHGIDELCLHWLQKVGQRNIRECFHGFWRCFGIACILIAKVSATTRLCFDRSIDTTLIFKSVFALTSAVATPSAHCWKFAQTGIGAS